MIPVNEAIITGVLLQCELKCSDLFNQFCFKVISFKKANFSEIDNIEQIRYMGVNATIWLLELDVINLTNKTISLRSFVLDKLILVDQEDFKYYIFDDYHLRCGSLFAKKSNLNRFYEDELIPNMKSNGTIPFILPDDDEAVYSISIQIGRIYAV